MPRHSPVKGTFIDAVRLAAAGGGHLLTRFLPESFDRRLSGALAPALAVVHRAKIARMEALVSELLDVSRDDARAIAERHFELRLEDSIAVVRALHHPPRLQKLALRGLEHWQAAMSRGRGAILWRMRFCNSMSVNAALAQAGIPVIHLSSETHGAHSRFGDLTIGRAVVKAESHFLAERVVRPSDGSLGYMKVLIERLQDNQTISLFADGGGRKTLEAPILGLAKEFALGAPALAYRCGAALLPVSAARKGPYDYEVTIEPAIEPDLSDLPQSNAPADERQRREAFVQRAVETYARRQETAVRANPSDWFGWWGWLGRSSRHP